MGGLVAGSRRAIRLTRLSVGTNRETLGIRRLGHLVGMSSGRRYRQVMDPKKATDDRDVIGQLVDVGENTLRRTVERPRRMVHGIEQRLRDVASRLRAIDPLDRRVAALEKRLDALEKPKAAARRQSGSAKPSTSRPARTAVAAKPGPAEHDLGPRSDAGVEGELERVEAQAMDEREPAG